MASFLLNKNIFILQSAVAQLVIEGLLVLGLAPTESLCCAIERDIVLVQPRKILLYMIEKLLTGT